MDVKEIIQSMANEIPGLDRILYGEEASGSDEISAGSDKVPTPSLEKAAAHESPGTPMRTFEDLCTGPFMIEPASHRDRYETKDDYEKQRDAILYRYCTSRYRHGTPLPDTGPVFGDKEMIDPFILRDTLFDRVLNKYPHLRDIRYIEITPDAGARKLIGIISKGMRFKAVLSPHVNEIVDLPKGSLVELDGEGRLLETVVFETLVIPLSVGSIYVEPNSLIHFEKGGFATGILASDQIYRGYPLKGDELVRWHMEVLRAGGLKDSLPGDVRDAILRRDHGECRHDKTVTTAWETNRMFIRGRLLTCHKTKTRTVHHGLPLENAKRDGASISGYVVGSLWHDMIKLHDMDFVKIDDVRGTVLSLTPVDDRIIQGRPCMEDCAVTFYNDGQIKLFTPAKNIEIGGVIWWKGRSIELNEKGEVVSGTPFGDQEIGGVKCPHGEEVLLHGNDRVKRAYIAEPQTIDGAQISSGETVEFNPTGRILSRTPQAPTKSGQ